MEATYLWTRTTTTPAHAVRADDRVLAVSHHRSAGRAGQRSLLCVRAWSRLVIGCLRVAASLLGIPLEGSVVYALPASCAARPALPGPVGVFLCLLDFCGVLLVGLDFAEGLFSGVLCLDAASVGVLLQWAGFDVGTRRHHTRQATRRLPRPQKVLERRPGRPTGAARRPGRPTGAARRRRGEPKSALAREFNISRETVYQYLRTAPTPPHRPEPSINHPGAHGLRLVTAPLPTPRVRRVTAQLSIRWCQPGAAPCTGLPTVPPMTGSSRTKKGALWLIRAPSLCCISR
jgi:hypothetical protein